MIRPLTFATCLLACGSGLYLYQSKHEVQVLDRTIERTVHDTASMREQSRLLAAEWTMLNDPERLRQFSNAYLNLKTITPSQFTSLADLDTKLAPAQTEVPSHAVDEQELVSQKSEPAPLSASERASEADAQADTVADAAPAENLPVPPIPAPVREPMVAAVTRSPDVQAPRPAEMQATRVNDPSVARSTDLSATHVPVNRVSDRVVATRSPVGEGQIHGTLLGTAMASAKPIDQRLRQPEQHAVARVAEAHVDVRTPPPPTPAPAPRPIMLAAPRPVPVHDVRAIEPVPVASRSTAVAASAPNSGSLLGIARGSMPPAPRPMPVNAYYNAN